MKLIIHALNERTLKLPKLIKTHQKRSAIEIKFFYCFLAEWGVESTFKRFSLESNKLFMDLLVLLENSMKNLVDKEQKQGKLLILLRIST